MGATTKLAAGMAVTLALGVAAVLAPDPAPRSDLAPLERAVRIASVPCANDLQAWSSGYLVDDRTVVTVAHALFESRVFALQDATGEWHEAEVVFLDRARDLAVLRAEKLRATEAPISGALPGDAVTMVAGAASGSVDGLVERSVRLSIEDIGDLTQRSSRSGYELDLPILAGDSGAAIVDTHGDLVAVVFAKARRGDGAWATSASEIDAVRAERPTESWACERESDVELQLVPLPE